MWMPGANCESSTTTCSRAPRWRSRAEIQRRERRRMISSSQVDCQVLDAAPKNDRRRALLGFPLIDHRLVGGSDSASEFRLSDPEA